MNPLKPLKVFTDAITIMRFFLLFFSNWTLLRLSFKSF